MGNGKVTSVSGIIPRCVLPRSFVYFTRVSHSVYPILVFIRYNLKMSSKKPRSSLCPGCKISKAFHSFGPPGKHCEGQTPESDEDLSLDHSSSPNGQILKAIRTLSEQVGALKIEQEDMRSRINDKEGGGAPEQHKAKTPQGKDCPNKSTN